MNTIYSDKGEKLATAETHQATGDKCATLLSGLYPRRIFVVSFNPAPGNPWPWTVWRRGDCFDFVGTPQARSPFEVGS